MRRDPRVLAEWRARSAARWRGRRTRSPVEMSHYLAESEARALMAGYRCEAAGMHAAGCPGMGGRAAGFEAHHVERRSKGGSDARTNLRWVWRGCHARIHDRPDTARARGLLS